MPVSASRSISSSRGQSGSAFEGREPPFVPWLALDEDGSIEHMTESARRVLEYGPDAPVDPYFFAHVHGRNLRRVMWDVAQMVNQRKQRAQWLLRLWTGNGRWRWYRAKAKSLPERAEGVVRIQLRPV